VVTAVQLMMNGISRFNPFSPLVYLMKAVLPGNISRTKRMVFENAPIITADGTINCCDFCPNSTVRNGRVVPVCLADHAEQLV